MASIVEVDSILNPTNLHAELHKILGTLRSHWEKDDVSIKELQGGLFNTVYSITCSTHPHDVLAMKTFSDAAATLIDHTQKSALNIHIANHTGLMEIYCRFQNGYIYKFYPGRLITEDDLTDPAVTRKVYELLHQLHSVVLPDVTGVQYDGTQFMLERSIAAIRKATNIKDDERLAAVGLSHVKVAELGEETLLDYLDLIKAGQPAVMCHGDPRPHNIVINTHTGEVHLIDWDITGVGAEIVDFAIMWSRDPVKMLENKQMLAYQNEAVVEQQLRLYLETHPQHHTHAQDVLAQWKTLFLKTAAVIAKLEAVISYAIFIIGPMEFDFIGNCLARIASAHKYEEMFEKEMDDA